MKTEMEGEVERWRGRARGRGKAVEGFRYDVRNRQSGAGGFVGLMLHGLDWFQLGLGLDVRLLV